MSISLTGSYPPAPIIMQDGEREVFVPEWPSQWLIYDEQTLQAVAGSRLYLYSPQQIQKMERILSALAEKHPVLQPPRMKKFLVTCPVRNYCIERLSTIGVNFFGNIVQGIKDTACCFCVSQSDPIPDHWVGLPQSLWERLQENQRDVSRDTACLLCVAPALIITATFVPAHVAITISLNLLLLYAAGIQTFLLVDYGSGELQATKLSKEGFDHLAKYLKDKWETTDNKIEVYSQARIILQNTPELIAAMVNSGIAPDSIDTILGDFNLVLRKIIHEGL